MKDKLIKILKQDKYTKIAILFIIIGFLLRILCSFLLFPTDDAGYYVGISKFIAIHGNIPLLDNLGREVFEKPPLFHLGSSILYIIGDLINEDFAIFMLKLLSPILSLIIMILTFKISKEYFNEKIACYATIFTSMIPVSIYINSMPLMDTLFFAAILTSIYYAKKNNVFATGISCGIILYSNQRGFFAFPIILWIVYQNNKTNIKRAVINNINILIISFLLFLPWIIRNWILLGNPIWPMFNSIFQNPYPFTYNLFSWNHLLYFKEYLITYFDIFALPAGDLSNFYRLGLPFTNIIIFCWIILTIIYIAPTIIGILKSNKEFIITSSIYSIPLIISNFMILLNHGNFRFRYLFPIIFIISLFWAIGIENMKINIKKNYLTLANIFIPIFALSTLIVIIISANAWHQYDSDFKWIKENTNTNNTIFIGNSQEFYFIFDRQVLSPEGYSYSNKYSLINKSNYIFRNDEFKVRDIKFPNEINDLLNNSINFKQVYFNNKTKTRVYKRII